MTEVVAGGVTGGLRCLLEGLGTRTTELKAAA